MKVRRAPSRHSMDARVYGHTTTAIHDMNPPPCPRLHFPAGGYNNMKKKQFRAVLGEKLAGRSWQWLRVICGKHPRFRGNIVPTVPSKQFHGNRDFPTPTRTAGWLRLPLGMAGLLVHPQIAVSRNGSKFTSPPPPPPPRSPVWWTTE